MVQTKDEQIENLEREFHKLLMMLQDKFPEAFKYYTDRLRQPNLEELTRK